MPVYTYKCNDCSVHVDEYRPMGQRDRKGPRCPKCNKPTRRDPFTRVHSGNQDYATPILSDAMGVQPSQVAEHRRLHPSIPILDDGRVVINSHAEHRRIMAARGFHDKSGFN